MQKRKPATAETRKACQHSVPVYWHLPCFRIKSVTHVEILNFMTQVKPVMDFWSFVASIQSLNEGGFQSLLVFGWWPIIGG